MNDAREGWLDSGSDTARGERTVGRLWDSTSSRIDGCFTRRGRAEETLDDAMRVRVLRTRVGEGEGEGESRSEGRSEGSFERVSVSLSSPLLVLVVLAVAWSLSERQLLEEGESRW